MKTALIALAIYPAFFGLIGFACYISGTAWPLFALILTPSWSEKPGKKRAEDQP